MKTHSFPPPPLNFSCCKVCLNVLDSQKGSKCPVLPLPLCMCGYLPSDVQGKGICSPAKHGLKSQYPADKKTKKNKISTFSKNSGEMTLLPNTNKNTLLFLDRSVTDLANFLAEAFVLSLRFLQSSFLVSGVLFPPLILECK